jgi:hypothetical protein
MIIQIKDIENFTPRDYFNNRIENQVKALGDNCRGFNSGDWVITHGALIVVLDHELTPKISSFSNTCIDWDWLRGLLHKAKWIKTF